MNSLRYQQKQKRTATYLLVIQPSWLDNPPCKRIPYVLGTVMASSQQQVVDNRSVVFIHHYTIQHCINHHNLWLTIILRSIDYYIDHTISTILLTAITSTIITHIYCSNLVDRDSGAPSGTQIDGRSSAGVDGWPGEAQGWDAQCRVRRGSVDHGRRNNNRGGSWLHIGVDMDWLTARSGIVQVNGGSLLNNKLCKQHQADHI